MNSKTREYVDKIAKVVEKFPDITKAVVVGTAVNDSYMFNDNIMLAVFTKPEAKYTKICNDLNYMLFDNNLTRVDLYMTADEDFYAAVYDFIDSGEVIFERK